MKQHSLTVIRCADCGRHGVSIDDETGCGTRITDHKCSGAWDVEVSVKLSQREWERLVEGSQHIKGVMP